MLEQVWAIQALRLPGMNWCLTSTMHPNGKTGGQTKVTRAGQHGDPCFVGYLFFSCGRVRDMVGQLLEFWVGLEANWRQRFPWKPENNQTKQNKTQTKAPNIWMLHGSTKLGSPKKNSMLCFLTGLPGAKLCPKWMHLWTLCKKVAD